MLDKYLSSDIKYSTDGYQLTSDVARYESIMTTDEDELMRETASILCSNSGSVLNVGFGMGIIDSYIKTHNPSEHCIIEAHPQVCKRADDMGFDVYCDKWESVVTEFIKDGKKFDSIYFDTFTFDYINHPQWAPFTKLVPKLLNPNGIYSFFNEYASKIEKVEEILQTFNWERHSKTIPFIRMVNGYELVWYINK